MQMTETELSLLDHLSDTADIIPDVFRTMLGVDVHPLAESAMLVSDHPVVAAIYLSGGWPGAILLQFDLETAFGVAERLMSIPRPSFVDDDVRDSLGEILNMIAGNLKSRAPSPTASSFPSVAEGSRLTYRVLGENQSKERCFETELGRFQVTLVENRDG